MKPRLLSTICLVMQVFHAVGQGEFLPDNSTAPTRLWSADGPLAGADILGQYLAGPTADALSTIGPPVPHFEGSGIVWGYEIVVPDVPCHSTAMVQLVVWDETLWGSSLENVPVEQQGMTDIVPVPLLCGTEPLWAPEFTQPAIVPIPEPSLVALLAVGGGGMLLARRLTPQPKVMAAKNSKSSKI